MRARQGFLFPTTVDLAIEEVKNTFLAADRVVNPPAEELERKATRFLGTDTGGTVFLESTNFALVVPFFHMMFACF